jgi:DNA (cytosine-5)-methyltransferase 1
MKILNLYAGIGGNRKLWKNEHEITAVEHNKEIAEVYADFFPNDKVIVADAHQYLLDHYKEYDFIWSSPPCPTHSDIRRCGVHAGRYEALYPQMDLYQEIILLKHFAKNNTKYVIENVKPYYKPLIEPDHKLHRHFYWSNFNISNFEVTNKRIHNNIVGSHTVYGFNIKDTKIKNKIKVLRNMVDPELGLHILNCSL